MDDGFPAALKNGLFCLSLSFALNWSTAPLPALAGILPDNSLPNQHGGDLKADTRKIKKININTATQAELQQLPGIGPAMAQRIVDYRHNNPPFHKIEELMIIKGISRKSLEKIRDRIAVE
jgi:comEA protein